MDDVVEEGRGGGGGRFSSADIGLLSEPLMLLRSGRFGVDLLLGGGGTRLIGGTGRVAMISTWKRSNAPL